MAGKCPASPALPACRQAGRRGPCLPAGRKGHNMNDISFARIRLATGVPGKPRPLGGELHILYRLEEREE